MYIDVCIILDMEKHGESQTQEKMMKNKLMKKTKAELVEMICLTAGMEDTRIADLRKKEAASSFKSACSQRRVCQLEAKVAAKDDDIAKIERWWGDAEAARVKATQERDDARDDLRAAKAKLAQVTRERDDAQKKIEALGKNRTFVPLGSVTPEDISGSATAEDI